MDWSNFRSYFSFAPCNPFSFEAHLILGSSRLFFQAKHTHTLSTNADQGIFRGKAKSDIFSTGQNQLPCFAEMPWITVLLSGKKTSLTHKTSSYPFLCLLSSVGRGGWRAEAFGHPPRIFCPATTLSNIRKPLRITSTKQITSTPILFLSPVVCFRSAQTDWKISVCHWITIYLLSASEEYHTQKCQWIILLSLQKANATTSFKNFLWKSFQKPSSIHLSTLETW